MGEPCDVCMELQRNGIDVPCSLCDGIAAARKAWPRTFRERATAMRELLERSEEAEPTPEVDRG